MHWRPAPAWLAAGLFLGVPQGALVGAVLLSSIDLFGGGRLDLSMAPTGLVVGGFAGGVVGLMVGLVMTFLGGSHLPGRQAQERAFLVTFWSTCILLFLPLSFFLYVGWAVAFASALVAGAFSYWLASLDMRSSIDSQRSAHPHH